MSKSNNRKHIKEGGVPDSKSVRSWPAPAIQEYPSWRFSKVDKDGPFCWPTDAEVLKEIFEELHSFDSMKWTELKGKNNHRIALEKLSYFAKKRLERLELDTEVDFLFSFRCTGKKRFFGIVVEGVVNLLWWDPDHEVCISKKTGAPKSMRDNVAFWRMPCGSV